MKKNTKELLQIALLSAAAFAFVWLAWLLSYGAEGL